MPTKQDVPETTHFAPHVRYEIGAFGWYLVDHLPASYDESKQVCVWGGWGGVVVARGRARERLGAIPLLPAAHLFPLLHPLPHLQAFVNEQGGRHKFFNVWPYIRPLRAWIK